MTLSTELARELQLPLLETLGESRTRGQAKTLPTPRGGLPV